MTRLTIDNPISGGFAQVPHVLWRWPGLSFKAKGFFCYLLSHWQGAIPPVATMEAESGLGRDARKAAMRELIDAGLAAWVIIRDPAGRVLSKSLTVSTRPLIAATLAEPHGGDVARHAPENPSHGAGGVHTPEKPSDGKSVAHRRKISRSSTENPAIKDKTKNKNGVASRTSGASKPRPLPSPAKGQARDGAGKTDRAKLLGFYGDLVRDPAKLCPASMIGPQLARDLLAAGEVTQAQLRERGISA